MAPRKRPLSVVTDSTPAPKLKTLTEAADDGNTREILVALRTRISKTVEDPTTPARDLAALSRRLMEIAKEINAIDAHDRGDAVGDAASTPDEAFDSSAI